MTRSITDLHNALFDVVIIGGGINGASSAQNLAAAGYSCLVVDKDDFGSGASGRSARMLHPGLRYFEARKPVRHFGLHPIRLYESLIGARQAIRSVGDHLKNAGDRIQPYRMCFPIYKGDDFKSWHVNAGVRMLELLSGNRVRLNFEMMKKNHATKVPFFSDFKDNEQIDAIACYDEFKFEWPERFCVDMLLDAQRNGTHLTNYCRAELAGQDANGDWKVLMHSTLEPSLAPTEVRARAVLNMAGSWIDEVLPPDCAPEQIVQTTKGTHIEVVLPDRYRGFGIATMNSLGLPYYILPMYENRFSIGVTETPFSGDATDITSTDTEVDFLLHETNRLLPALNLRRSDVLRTWAGVRPLTTSKTAPAMGSRTRKLHDLSEHGMPNVWALTSGPIMTHRESGRLIKEAVATRVKPSGTPSQIDHTPFQFSDANDSEPFIADEPDVRIADLQQAITSEHGKTLADVLIRRTGLAWRRNLTRDEVTQAADHVAHYLNWSPADTQAQVAQYLAYQERYFRKPAQSTSAQSQPGIETRETDRVDQVSGSEFSTPMAK